MKLTSTSRQLERFVRGFSCHRRIQILELLTISDEALSLTEIAKGCNAGLNPIVEHVRRLYLAGLINKASRQREVMHDLTPLGKKVVAFLRSVEP